ncbi:RDD family protein [Kitasatospora sp. NPDC091335]|uniref:RDD family protein n=1 Tax=Kitasatospora sp. NPDC091335 TaxID=3364085 RepID=UPI0037FF479C
MTDRPFADAGDPAVAPEPGYYPDPSIPGFVRYWGGSAWVPGTTRLAPAEGEVLEAPRYATRRPAPDGGAARVVPPPVVPSTESSVVPPVVPPVAPSVVAPVLPPVGVDAMSGQRQGPGQAPDLGPPGLGPAAGMQAMVVAGMPAGGGDTGPVYFDQTSGGASFVLGSRVAEVIGGPVFRTVDAQGAPSAAPSGFAGIGLPGAPDEPVAVGAMPGTAPRAGAVPVPAPSSAPAASSAPAPAPAAAEPGWHGESGWQADPRAQRGLVETGDAPRWVSWGVLPEALDADQGRAEPERASAAVEPVATGAPAVAVAMAVREAPVPAVLASGPVPVLGGEAAPVAAAPVASTPAVATAGSAPVAPLPTVRTVRETAVQPRPSGAAPVPAASPRGSRAAKGSRGSRAAVPAGLGRRLAARAVDTAVLLVVAVAAGIPLGRSVTDHLQRKLDQARMASALTRRQIQVWLVDDVVLGKIAVLIGILLFVSLLYEVLPIARTGQTFGKRLARIRVVDAAAPAARARLSLGRSLLRWAVRQLGVLLLLGLVWPVFDRTARRGWQDRAARTRVVRG